MKRNTVYLLAASTIISLLPEMSPRTSAGETLYNGIVLPAEWPPQASEHHVSQPTPPYLLNPPAVIPIDTGRQLFVDDFLIASTDMGRTWHKATWHPANPVITYDQTWEFDQNRPGNRPAAGPYSGGAWYDPSDSKYKLWYMGGYLAHLCLATSNDGVTWTKPDYDVVPGSNIVVDNGATESNVVWLDLNDLDPNRRWKYFVFKTTPHWSLHYYTSPDGIHWSGPHWNSGLCGDRSTVFYNPFRSKWVFSLRDRGTISYFGTTGRARRYFEVSDINDGAAVQWPGSGLYHPDTPIWTRADTGRDQVRVDLGQPAQLYNLDCVAYESLVLGMFNMFRGNFDEDGGDGRQLFPGRPKLVDICIGYSRDGFHWQRPDHRAFASISDRSGDWNWGNVQSTGNSFLVKGDYLYFYASGRAGNPGVIDNSTNAYMSTGLAVLRRDGFASMVAESTERTLTTRIVRFSGKHLFVNVSDPAGELRVEALDADGSVIAPYSRGNCNPISVNKTLQPVTWNGAADISALSGQDVRFRFYMTNGSLYSFWVSPDASGASYGYVAGGGPGFTAHTDTVGTGNYTGNQPPIAHAGPGQIMRDTDGDGTHTVTLDGTGSTDNDGTVSSYIWHENGSEIATGAKPNVELTVGAHRIQLTVTDNNGAAGYDELDITLQPQTDPFPPRRNMVMWLKADDITGLANGAPVTTWVDSSGNGLDPTQADPTLKPVWIASAVNSQPAVRFDGTDDHMRMDWYRSLMWPAHQATCFVVFKPEDITGTRVMVGQNWAEMQNVNGTFIYESKDWLQFKSSVGVLTVNEWYIGTMRRAGPIAGETQLFLNGIQDDNGIAVPYHDTQDDNAKLGCARNNRYFWKGDIAEILIYCEALSDSDRRAVESYLAQKYGVGDEVATLYGDANEDGTVGMGDLNTLVDWILGRTPTPDAGSPAFTNGDVDDDNAIGMSDLNLLVDFILGRVTKFPVE